MACALYSRGDLADLDLDADTVMLCRTRSPNVVLRRQRSVEALRSLMSGGEPEPDPEPGWYYLDSQGQQHGPVRLELLREWHAAGVLPRGLSTFWRSVDDEVTSAQELFGEYDDDDDDDDDDTTDLAEHNDDDGCSEQQGSGSDTAQPATSQKQPQPQPQPQTTADDGAGAGLTAAALAAVPQPQQKQMIGERLYPLIQTRQPELAGKITGMLLEMDNSDLLLLLEDSHGESESLAEKISEALTVLEEGNYIPPSATHKLQSWLGGKSSQDVLLSLAELDALAALDGAELQALVATAAEERRLAEQQAALEQQLVAAQVEAEELEQLICRARQAARPCRIDPKPAAAAAAAGGGEAPRPPQAAAAAGALEISSVRKRLLLRCFIVPVLKNRTFTKTGSGQNRRKVENEDGLFLLQDAPEDHHYLSRPEASAKESKRMMRRAGAEWQQMAGGGLPTGITVQVYEGRMDLLRAAVEGPRDTPYEGGLFVFDLYLPPQYPDVPPEAFYWAYGKYINPNLYECGKVCLSLLGTWAGPGWEPHVSTLLQLLVSIQGMILIEQPYCNEPGQQRDGGSEQATEYNKAVQAGVCDNMAKMIASPPEGLATVVAQFAARDGPALLRRAAVLGNEGCTDAHITALDTALGHPFGHPLTTRVENTGSSAVGGVEEVVPRWLTVAETPFTSGYVDEEMDDFDDY